MKSPGLHDLALKTPICYMFLSDGRQSAKVTVGVTQHTFHSSEQNSERAESGGQRRTRAGMGWRGWSGEGLGLAWEGCGTDVCHMGGPESVT